MLSECITEVVGQLTGYKLEVRPDTLVGHLVRSTHTVAVVDVVVTLFEPKPLVVQSN